MPNGEEQYGVDICVVSYHSAPVIGAALDHVATHLPGAHVRLREHGDDSQSTDALRAIAEAHPLAVTVDVDTSNPGFGAGCNALARQSTAPWLLFLNPDATVLAWPWSAEHPPPRGAVIGPLMAGVGESARQSGVSYRVRDEIRRSWFRRPGPPPTTHGFVSGAALLIDRESFERVGGFDERYFMFYEDIDLCLRANAAGIATSIEPSWRVRHDGGHATRKRFGDALEWSYRSACRFHGRLGSRLVGYRAYVVVDSLLRAALGLVVRNRRSRTGYVRLARIAAADVLRGAPTDR